MFTKYEKRNDDKHNNKHNEKPIDKNSKKQLQNKHFPLQNHKIRKEQKKNINKLKWMLGCHTKEK